MPAPPPAYGPDRSYRMTKALVSRWHTYPKDTGDRSPRAALPLWLTMPRQYGLSQNFRFPHAYQDASADIVVSHLLLRLVGTPWSSTPPLICPNRCCGVVAKSAAEGR